MLSPSERNARGEDAAAEKPKFTPGPWEVFFPVSSGATRPGVDAANGPTIILWGSPEDSEGVYGEGDGEAVNNAHLIAAAPELYEALRAIQDFCDDPNGSEKPETLASGLARLLPAARAAIAKAEGR